jgi:thiamine biosynthesis lipoprotein
MVELGGEIRVRGSSPRGGPWRIGIERPDPERRGVQHVVQLTGMAMATSGDYRNYREEEGRRLSHLIDPRTGRPIEHHLASVTVLDPLCARADAFATALIVLGAEQGYALAERENLAAYFIIRQGEGFSIRTTPAFDRLEEALSTESGPEV